MQDMLNRFDFNEAMPARAVGAAPKVLLTATVRWPNLALLAIALARAGSDVSVVCPPRCPLPRARAVRHRFHYSRLQPLKSLSLAIESVHPEVVIPCDDQAVQHLHELDAKARRQGAAGNKTIALIEKSLGPHENYPIVRSRCGLVKLARELGIRVPETEEISSRGDLENWQARHQFPCVMKVDGTCGGYGVQIANNAAQAEQGFLTLTRFFNFSRVIKRLCINQDPFRLWPWLNGAKPMVSIQSYVRGWPANCAAVCREGKISAAIAVEVASTVGETGRASIVWISDKTEMIQAAERIASRLKLSGFFGLDFMIEEGTNLPYLIELNPRPTRLSSLQLGKGRDLIGALHAQISGQPPRELPSVTEKKMIAYFPDAWQADSRLLESSYHDIPEEEPDLVQELRQTRRPNLLNYLMTRVDRIKSPQRMREAKNELVGKDRAF